MSEVEGRLTLISRPKVRIISAVTLVKLSASPKIIAPSKAPPPGTAAKMMEVLPFSIVRDACATKRRPIRFGTKP